MGCSRKGGGRAGFGLVACSYALLVVCVVLLGGSDGAGIRENVMVATEPSSSLENQEKAEAFRFLRSRSELRETTANELDSDDDEDDQEQDQAGSGSDANPPTKEENTAVEEKPAKAKAEEKEMANEEEAAEEGNDADDDDDAPEQTAPKKAAAPANDEGKEEAKKIASGEEDEDANDDDDGAPKEAAPKQLEAKSKAPKKAASPAGNEAKEANEEEADDDDAVAKAEEQGSKQTTDAKKAKKKVAKALLGKFGLKMPGKGEASGPAEEKKAVATKDEGKPAGSATGSSGPSSGEAAKEKEEMKREYDETDDDDAIVAKAEEQGSKKTANAKASSGGAAGSNAATAASGPSRDEAEINAEDEEDDDEVEPEKATGGAATGTTKTPTNSAAPANSTKTPASPAATGAVDDEEDDDDVTDDDAKPAATGTKAPTKPAATGAPQKSAATGVQVDEDDDDSDDEAEAEASSAKDLTGMTGARQPKGPVVTGSKFDPLPNSTKTSSGPAATGAVDDDEEEDATDDDALEPKAGLTGAAPAANSTKTSSGPAATGAVDEEEEEDATDDDALEPKKAGATGAAPATNRTKKSVEDMDGEDEEKEEKEDAIKNMTIDGISMKDTTKLNSELPKGDKFLNGSAILDAIADTAVTEEYTGDVGATGTAAVAADDYSKVTKAMLGPTKAEEEYEPVHIKEEGGTVLVHKLTRQPLLESPIVLPTIQRVDTLKEIDSVRTPVDHVPANYNGKALSALLHRQDEAQLQQLPVRKPSEPSAEGKSQDDLAKEAPKWRDLGKKYSALANEAEQSSANGSTTKSAPEIIEEQKKTPAASMVDAITIVPRTPRLRGVVRKAGDTFKQVQNDRDLGLFGHEQQV